MTKSVFVSIYHLITMPKIESIWEILTLFFNKNIKIIILFMLMMLLLMVLGTMSKHIWKKT